MKKPEQKQPLAQNTKDDSSDADKLPKGKQGPPPQPRNTGTPGNREDEEAEKGHA
ncbi:hypothetical protein [Pontibacter liquoris]|uniref:hypothetical protein n=1 Tax=Pontibacter liquoris TaxID=2905677 RepID=UPI001FA7596A|nr:hypothetical protein [Pontibacter liquoris]